MIIFSRNFLLFVWILLSFIFLQHLYAATGISFWKTSDTSIVENVVWSNEEMTWWNIEWRISVDSKIWEGIVIRILPTVTLFAIFIGILSLLASIILFIISLLSDQHYKEKHRKLALRYLIISLVCLFWIPVITFFSHSILMFFILW